jgi:acetyl-CoA carboxylase biotin carboxyl carrier protein
MNVERIEALAKLLHGSRARELAIETETWRISLRKAALPRLSLSGGLPSPPPAPGPEAEEAAPFWISAPLVGIFRQASPRVQVGDQVSEGQIVGALESMKILNPLVSERDGEVLELLVEDGQPVEYGQPLLHIRPLS